MNIHLFFNTFCKIGLSKLTSIFDSILVPTCLHFPSKNRSKLDQNWNLEGIEFLIDFCIDFLSIFLRFGTPTWSYVGPLDASKTPPRRLQDGSQDKARDIFRSWSIFGRCLIDFGSSFGWFSIDFWLIWGWFLKGFGQVFSNDFSWFWVVFCLMFNWFWVVIPTSSR